MLIGVKWSDINPWKNISRIQLLSDDRRNCKSPRCCLVLARWIDYRETLECVGLSNNRKDIWNFVTRGITFEFYISEITFRFGVLVVQFIELLVIRGCKAAFWSDIYDQTHVASVSDNGQMFHYILLSTCINIGDTAEFMLTWTKGPPPPW